MRYGTRRPEESGFYWVLFDEGTHESEDVVEYDDETESVRWDGEWVEMADLELKYPDSWWSTSSVEECVHDTEEEDE